MALEVLKRGQFLGAAGTKFSTLKPGPDWAFLAILVFLPLPNSDILFPG